MSEAARPSAVNEWVRITRQHWGVSQSQFATLFATSVRSVRRWENGQLEPRGHQLWLFGLLVEYATVHGLDQFLRRFVNQTGRLSRAGRPRSRTSEKSSSVPTSQVPTRQNWREGTT